MIRPSLLPAAAVLCALAAGCSGSSTHPTTLPSLTPTPSATPTPAMVPLDAEPETQKSLDVFVRFYFQQLNEAFSTGDSSKIRTHSEASCVTCSNYATGLEQNRDQVIQGMSFDVIDVAAPPVTPAGSVVEVFGETPLRRLARRDGTIIRTLAATGPFHFQVKVLRSDDKWSVAAIRFAPSR